MLLQIHDDRAVAAPFTLCPIVHPNNPGCSLVRQRHPLEQPQHSVSARRHGQAGEQSCAGFSPQGAPSLPLRFDQPARAPGKGHDQIRQAFGKGLAGTGCIAAIEPAHAQADGNSAPERGQISRVPIIPAVHGPAYSAAVRTAAAATQAMGRNVKTGWTVGCDLFDATAWNETESVHPLFNGGARASSQISVLVRHDPRKVRENRSYGQVPGRIS